MKKQIILGLALVGIMVSSGCKKLNDLVKANVNLTMSTLSFDIPVTAQGSLITTTASTSMDVDALIKQNAGSNFGIKNIKSLKVTSCDLTLSNSDATNNFGNLSNCKLELSSSTSPNFTAVANLATNPDANVSTLSIPVDGNVELKDYFSAPSFSVRISGATRRATTKVLTCTAVIKYTAQVGL